MGILIPQAANWLNIDLFVYFLPIQRETFHTHPFGKLLRTIIFEMNTKYLVWFLSWWDIHITDSAILQTGQYTQLAALCGNTHALYQKARLRWQNAASEVFIVLAVFVCSWVLLLWFWEYNVVSRSGGASFKISKGQQRNIPA